MADTIRYGTTTDKEGKVRYFDKDADVPTAQEFGPGQAIVREGAKLKISDGESWYTAAFAVYNAAGRFDGVIDANGNEQLLKSQNYSSVGTKTYMHSATADFNNSSAYTFEDIVALSAEFDQIQIIINSPCNSAGTTAEPLYTMAVAALPNDTLTASNAATWTPLPFSSRSGSEYLITDTALVQDNKYRFLLQSEWIDLPSLPRDDSGQFSLLGIRTWMFASNPITLNGNGINDLTGWATHASGRTWQTNRNAGGNNATTNTNAFVRTAAMSQSPVYAIRFRAKSGRVLNLYVCGDSISESSTGAIYGDNWAFRLSNLLHTSALPVELVRVGKTGQPSDTYTDSFIDLVNVKNNYLLAKKLAISSGSTGYVAGEIIYLKYGGIIKVDTVAAGVITAATIIQMPNVLSYQKEHKIFSAASDQLYSSAAGTGARFIIYFQQRCSLPIDGYGIIMLHTMSPNGYSSGTLDATKIANERANTNRMIDVAHNLGLKVAVWTPLPAGIPAGESGTGRSNWGSSDSFRQDYSVEILNGLFKADLLLDFSWLASETLVSGQQTYKPQYGTSTVDWLHPSDTAATDMANYAATVISR